MNLEEIRNAILVGSDYSPDSSTYHQWLNNFIDQTYREMWDSKAWVFTTKTESIPVFADKRSTSWGNITLAVVNGDTTITASDDLFHSFDATQVIEIGGMEYRIASIISKATASLNQPYRGTTNSEDTTWVIKHRDIYLPKDCSDVLNVRYTNAPVAASSKGYGDLPQLVPGGYFSPNDVGTPSHYMMNPDHVMRSPMTILTPVLTQDTTVPNGTLGVGTYRFTYSFVASAQDNDLYGYLPESDPWPGYVEIVIPSGGSYSAKFTVFAPQSRYNAADKPQRIKIYSVNIMYDGRLELQEMRAPTEDGPCYASTSGIEYISNDMYSPSSQPYRHPKHGGVTKSLSLYPRPSADDYTVTNADQWLTYARSFIEVTYLARPEHLIYDSDVPALPEPFHQILVLKGMQEVAMRNGNMSASRIHESRVNERMAAISNRYLDHKDITIQRGRRWGTDGKPLRGNYPLVTVRS